MNLDYEVKFYKRTKEYRAPPELEQAHPLGKSPVLDVIRNGKKKVIAETGHIIDYLIKHYDTEKKLVPKSEDDQEQVDYFLHYCEGTLQPLLVGLLVNGSAVQLAPFPARFLVKIITGEINKAYYKSELLKNLEYLEKYLTNRQYFVGDRLSGADIIFEFPLIQNLTNNSERIKTFAGNDFDFKKLYPNIVAWAARMQKQPNLVKANEKVAKL